MLPRFLFAFAVLFLGTASAQSVISAHSGVIQYVEGSVLLDGKQVAPKFAEFPDVKTGQTLAADDGRAEVLLTPGVFLRLAENSSFRMASNKLSDTRIEILTGSVLVEVGELLPDNVITLQFHDAQVALLKKGLYRVDADSAALRVYNGEARVTSGSETVVAKRGRAVQLEAVLEAHNFDTRQTDSFYRWSARRDEYVAQANIVAAKSSGYTSKGSGNWAWNPWFGMFTFLPGTGIYQSPFGYWFYSPATVYYVYSPPQRAYWGGGSPSSSFGGFAGGAGYGGSPGLGPASSGGGSVAASPSIGHSAPASSAPVSAGGMRGAGGARR